MSGLDHLDHLTKLQGSGMITHVAKRGRMTKDGGQHARLRLQDLRGFGQD